MNRLALTGPDLLVHPLAAAVVEVIVERGYEEAEVEEIVARAGVDREEFDGLFADKPDAVLSILESHIEDLRRRIWRVYSVSPRWPENLRAAAREAVAWIEDHPRAYRFGMWRILEAGEMARLRREELFEWCAGLVDEGRAVAADPDAVPAATPMIVIGAVAEALTRHAAGEFERPPAELVPELMYWAVRPYLGEEAARSELEHAATPGR
ncbi:MAG TPA: hypothetical protein VMH33_02750 [Solirubrobacterales bacterium]|nr:hypothetical protein [Solirubrobacterales bacterium]